MKSSTTVAALMLAGVSATSLAAIFTPGNLVVSQVGDGGAALNNAATAVSLRELTLAGTTVQSFPMPTAASGLNRRFSVSGTATSEGMLTRSTNGQYLTIAGYDAAIGTASVVTTTAAANPRVVGRADVNGAIDTTTGLTDAYSGNNVRSVASDDGVNFWTAGTAGGTGGGVRYTTLGSSTSTILSTTITNTRVVNIFSGQLYTSSATGAFQGVSTVGSGLPTSSGNTISLLPGFPTATGPGAYDYFFSNPSTLYVADDRATASGGGLQKWTLASGTWTLAYTLNNGLTAGLRGLTGGIDPAGGVVLYATTADAISAANGNKLVSVLDAGAASAFTTIATAPGNTAWRGVDFTPVPAPGALAVLGLSGLLASRRRR